jgi:hypothetical protein
MQDDSVPSPPLSIDLLPYHAALRDFLRHVDADVWKWFAERRLSPKYAEDVRFELLKSTYRIERDSQRSLYEQAEEVARQLGIAAPITIYQAQNPLGLNASLAYVPGEVHVLRSRGARGDEPRGDGCLDTSQSRNRRDGD